MRLAIANLKGGVGKTTTAVALAECASAKRGARVLLVDADPQRRGTALRWSEMASFRSDVVSLPASVIGRDLDRRAAGYDHVVIDTPPGHEAIVRKAVGVVDLVVMPLSPSLAEVDALAETVELCRSLRTPAAALIVQQRARTRIATEVEIALIGSEVPLLSARIPMRTAFSTSFGANPPLDYYKSAWRELVKINKEINL